MSTQATSDKTGPGGSRKKKRRMQGIGAGTRWANFVAPRSGGRRRVAIAFVETVVATLASVVLCEIFSPHDPLLIGTGGGWIWIVPIVIALRYGTILGACSGVLVLAVWYTLYPGGFNPQIVGRLHIAAATGVRGTLPVGFFFSGFVLTMLCGQFGDVWITRLRQARAANEYLAEQLAVLTRNQFMLRLSHERLEQDLMSRPATLRDSLLKLRQTVLAQEPVGDGDVPLRGAQLFLDTASQACQFERASIHAWRDGGPVIEASAAIGAPFTLDPNDPLLREALNIGTLVHVSSVEQQQAARSAYIVCVPLVDALKTTIGIVVVESLPFLALTTDNLQFLLVLCHHYADGVRHAAVTQEIIKEFQSCPYEFALDYARLSHLVRDTKMPSSLVALRFETDERSAALFDSVLRTRRALDMQWPIRDGRHLTMLTLMPLSGEGAVDGYLMRIEENMRARFGVDFESAHVVEHAMAVPGEQPVAALRRLLELNDVRV
ncbi:MAG TPA: PelD GGDEF domain-containing protein [Paraburkholderia sp.]|jgi:hypothetical protein